MLLPGPEAHQLTIYIGWLLHRVRGGLVAGTLFVLPGLFSLGLLSWIYARFGDIGFVQGLFFGLKAAVLAIVLDALRRVARRALQRRVHWSVAGLAFLGIFAFAVPFPLIIIGAAALGLAVNAAGLDWFTPESTKETETHEAVDGRSAHLRPSLPRLLRTAILWLGIWLGPLVALRIWLGPDDVFTEIAGFNSKMAAVTFGGAYAALAYMAQQAVETYHWLQPDEMLVGLGFAETTPGPLICVVQFVGFLAAFRRPGGLDSGLAGTLGGLLAAWATFVPSFLWIFAGGPYIEALRGNRVLAAGLSAITAAIVGVILNLAVWFALHTLFGRLDMLAIPGVTLAVPDWRSANLPAIALSIGAILGVFRLRLGMLPVFGSCAVLGAAGHLFFG
jgi:chromate transporter